jgi:hypothetical protein
MNPLTGVSLAANIVQFVEFACKLVTITTSFSRSPTGELEQHNETSRPAKTKFGQDKRVWLFESVSTAKDCWNFLMALLRLFFFLKPKVQLLLGTFRDFVLDKDMQEFTVRQSVPNLAPLRSI